MAVAYSADRFIRIRGLLRFSLNLLSLRQSVPVSVVSTCSCWSLYYIRKMKTLLNMRDKKEVISWLQGGLSRRRTQSYQIQVVEPYTDIPQIGVP